MPRYVPWSEILFLTHDHITALMSNGITKMEGSVAGPARAVAKRWGFVELHGY